MGLTLTVFTPTYNRLSLLKRCHESLLSQTRQDFCWLIVDDGSTDGTGEEVQRWRQDSPFPIEYMWQENGGKMRAHNTGVKHTETPLFVCLDSDDYFTKAAVNDILCKWSEAGGDPKCGGIVAHKGSDEKRPLYGEDFPSIEKSTLSNLYNKGFHGETTLVYRTDLLKKHPFPEIKGEKYVPEDYVYDQIDREAYLAVLPEILTVCELIGEGYTDRVEELRRENPTGWYLYYVNRARFTGNSLLRLKYLSHCLRFSKAADPYTVSREGLPWHLKLLGLPGAICLTIMRKL